MAPTTGWPLIRAYVGERENRRHKPGRAFERIDYRFDVLTDYGAFRDLQRHRMLTIEWQPLTPDHGYVRPELIDEAGMRRRVRRGDGSVGGAVRRADAGVPRPGAATPCRWRTGSATSMQFNAREAIHLLELRIARRRATPPTGASRSRCTG